MKIIGVDNLNRDEISDILVECSEEGWDGYDAKPISNKSAEYALRFIEKLDRSVPLPDLVPEPNGELGMLWEKNGNSLVIGIDNNKVISYADVCHDGGSNHGTSKFSYDIPLILKALLLTKY